MDLWGVTVRIMEDEKLQPFLLSDFYSYPLIAYALKNLNIVHKCRYWNSHRSINCTSRVDIDVMLAPRAFFLCSGTLAGRVC